MCVEFYRFCFIQFLPLFGKIAELSNVAEKKHLLNNGHTNHANVSISMASRRHRFGLTSSFGFWSLAFPRLFVCRIIGKERNIPDSEKRRKGKQKLCSGPSIFRGAPIGFYLGSSLVPSTSCIHERELQGAKYDARATPRQCLDAVVHLSVSDNGDQKIGMQ
jgi:hypothetical protein